MKKYNLVICGGTFDLFHKGHKAFIKEVLNQSEKIILGITSDSYIKSFKRKERIESFVVRKKAVEQFLESLDSRNRAIIISIDNPYEPLLGKSFDPNVIFVTPQTKNTAEDINRKRKEKGLKALKVILLPLRKAQDGETISSTRIRSGEINREGRIYISPKWKNKKLILPLNMREVLSKPLGEVLSEVPEDVERSKTITVGDITTQKFNKDKINQFLSIIDFLVQRKRKFNSLSQLGFDKSQKFILVKNSPGTINSKLFEIIKEIFKEKDRRVILVEGEEDLTALVVLLVAPLGYTIFYGQPNQGLVKVNVSEKSKERASKLLDSFIVK